jgi:hypothetical protein
LVTRPGIYGIEGVILDVYDRSKPLHYQGLRGIVCG